MLAVWLAVFVSYPPEAALTCIARGLEVLERVDGIVLVATREWREFVEKLRDAVLGLGIDARVFSDFPDPYVDPRGFDLDTARRYLQRVASEVGDDICLAISSGSRLEISLASRFLEHRAMLYVSFGWGPWRGAFYPFTPRPIEIAYLLGDAPRRSRVDASLVKSLANALRGFLGSLPRLRRRVLEVQVDINSLISDPLAMPSLGAGCPSLRARVSCGGIGRELVVRNLCDPVEVLERVGSFAEELRKRIEEHRVSTPFTYRGSPCIDLVSTILELCGFEILATSDGTVFVDALSDLVERCREKVAIDTNTLFAGLHIQLYDSPEAVRDLVYPLCIDLEIYRKLVDAASREKLIEAYLATLAQEEIASFSITRDFQASSTPCEVALYLSRYCTATADRRAYERLLKKNTCSELLELEPLHRATFRPGYLLRRASYAYYAIAQLAAINRIVNEAVRELRIAKPIAIDIHIDSTKL